MEKTITMDKEALNVQVAAATDIVPVKAKRKCGLMRKLGFAMAATGVMATATSATALASGWDTVTVNGSPADAQEMMGRIIGILLTISRFVGVALVVYGIYEVVMSFMQNQPEAKTKGIIMALAGIVMTSLKSILVALGVVS